MRVWNKLRYEQTISRIKRRFRSVVILFLIAGVLLGAGTLLKNLVLNQIKGRIQASFGYTRLTLKPFPPALVLDDVRSVSLSPFFSAKRILVKISLRSLLSREKPFDVFIEKPVLRIFAGSGDPRTSPADLDLAFPFIIESGLIRDGELFYWGEETRIHATGIHARFTQRRDAFAIKAEITESTFNLGGELPVLESRISLAVEGIGNDVKVQKLKLNGPFGTIRAQGQVIDPRNPEIQLEASYYLETDMIARLLALPFTWKGRTEGRGALGWQEGRLLFRGSVSSQDLVLSQVPMGETQGTVFYNHGSGGTVDLNFRKPRASREYIRIVFDDNRVEGVARGIYLDPVARFLEIPWPIASPAWGEFSIQQERLSADLEFRDELIQETQGEYPFQGKVRLDWNGRDELTFSSQELDSSFARVRLEGSLTVEQSLDITINGEVKDGRLARDFTSLILRKEFPFPEIRGQGQADIHIFGDILYPQVKAEIVASPAGFDTFDADSVKGEVELIREDFFGRFEVEDPDFTGRIGLFSNASETKVDIWVESGRIERILPAMNIELPLKGEASGYLNYTEKNEKMQYEGNFASDQLDFAGRSLSAVKGEIKGDDASIQFSEMGFGFHGGQVRGSAYLNPVSREFNLDLEGEGIDLSSINPRISGIGSLELQGKGILGQDRVAGTYTVEDLLFLPFQPMRSQGDIYVGYDQDMVTVDISGRFLPGENDYAVNLQFAAGEDLLTGQIKGAFRNMDLLMPWQGVKATINYLADLNGRRLAPHIQGGIDFEGELLPFPRFAHAFRDFKGLVLVNDGHLDIRSFQGKFGGGDVTGSGSLDLGREGVEEIDVRAEGTDMSLALLERTAARTGGNIRLLKNAEQFVLEGDFLVDRLTWRREITEKFSFSSSAFQQPRRKEDFFEDLTLNIRMRAFDNAWMDNSLGRIRGRFDLTVTGNIYNPVLMGDIEVLEGDVDLQDRSFEVLHGRLSFFNPAIIEPYIVFRGETYIKDYRVTLRLNGLPDSLNPELTSSPPLPPEDIWALIALGESFRRTYQFDQSERQGTASLLSFTLSEAAEKSAQRLFSVDQFRIDPFIMGSSSEVTARLTVGKRVARNFFILYATNLATEREDIVRFEMELSRDLSLVGIRDEDGRISIDVKIHKRF